MLAPVVPRRDIGLADVGMFKTAAITVAKHDHPFSRPHKVRSHSDTESEFEGAPHNL
jgi:hypothetical protein